MPDSAVEDYRPSQHARAFSLIELLTAVSIMMVIIYALYAMFNQTQKALRANITQVDVLESGRAASEMIGRELEQVAACGLAFTTNIYTWMGTNLPLTQMDVDQSPGATPLRTNLVQEFFFLRREPNKWIGTGYRVIGQDVGTLYRFNTSTNYRGLNYTNLIWQFMDPRYLTNASGQVASFGYSPVTEGVIHLTVTAYDPEGRRFDVNSTNVHPHYRVLRLDRNGNRLGLYSSAATANDANVIIQPDPRDPFRLQTRFAFLSNALPAYVEVELGVLEPATLKRYKSLRDSPKAAEEFLRKQAAKVHLFRQRIPIRTALQ